MSMFRSALLRLTGWYLALVMLLSLGFSVVLYRVQRAELGRGLRQQVSYVQQFPFTYSNQLPSQLEELRQQELDDSQNRIIAELIYFNLAILVIGGAASYFLARYTLQPIEEAHEAQSRFTADASHELRTPLAAIRAEIEVGLRDPKTPPDELRGLLGSTLEEVDKLEALATGLLSLSRVEVGKSLERHPSSLQAVVTDAVSRVSPLAERQHITIQQKVEEASFLANQPAIAEVLVILLDNAIKYSPAHSTITVRAGQGEKEVHIAVVDQGCGIKASDIPHIFDRFYRADRSRSKENVKGYGLGLSIAHRIVRQHHGKITVESTPEKGSTFTVHLPK